MSKHIKKTNNNLNLGAFDKETNRYVYPNIAEKNKVYHCPDCDNKLDFCKGEKRIPYFRHCRDIINKCSYYDKPNESQIHKDAKLLMKRLLEDRVNIVFNRKCIDCKQHQEFPLPSWDKISEIKLEYHYDINNNKKSADVACIQKNIDSDNLLYIIEICQTHKTESRPEPWYEVDANNLLDLVNNTDTKISQLNLDCIRRNKCKECINEEQERDKKEKEQISNTLRLLDENEIQYIYHPNKPNIIEINSTYHGNNKISFNLKDNTIFCHNDWIKITIQQLKQWCSSSTIIKLNNICVICYYTFRDNLTEACLNRFCDYCDIIYLETQYNDIDNLNSLGAKWDPLYKKWYITKLNSNIDLILKTWQQNDDWVIIKECINNNWSSFNYSRCKKCNKINKNGWCEVCSCYDNILTECEHDFVSVIQQLKTLTFDIFQKCTKCGTLNCKETILKYKIKSEDLDNIKKSYKMCDRSKTKVYNRKTALMISIVQNQFDITKELLKKVDLNVQDNDGNTALIYISKYNRLNLIKELLKEKVDLNIQDNNGKTALMISIEHKNFDITRELLKEKVDLNIRDNNGKTALMISIENEYINIILDLLKIYVNSNIQDEYGKTPLMICIECKKFNVARELLKEKIDLNSQDNNGKTVLMICIENKLKIARELLKEKVDLNNQDKNGKTALILSIEHKNLKITQELLKENLNVNIQDKEGKTALMFSMEKGYFDITQELLKKQIDTNIQDNYGKTILMYASRYSCSNTAKELIRLGANVNIQDKEGKTALMISLENKQFETTQELLKEKVDFTIKDNNGKTLLMYASRYCLYTTKELLKLNFDVNIRDNYGDTALTISLRHNVGTIMELLKEKIDTNIQYENGKTILMISMEKQYFYITQELLKKQIDANIQDNYGKTILMYASRYDCLYTTKELIRLGANVNIQDKDGKTALMYTIHNQQFDTFKELIKVDTHTQLNIRDKNNKTVLYYAKNNKKSNMIDKLIDTYIQMFKKNKKIDLNIIQDLSTFETSLLLATKRDNLDVIRELLKVGMDPNIQNNQKQTALMIASERGNLEIIKELLNAGADPTIKNKSGKTALMIAKDNDNINIFNELKNVNNYNQHDYINTKKRKLSFSEFQ